MPQMMKGGLAYIQLVVMQVYRAFKSFSVTGQKSIGQVSHYRLVFKCLSTGRQVAWSMYCFYVLVKRRSQATKYDGNIGWALNSLNVHILKMNGKFENSRDSANG